MKELENKNARLTALLKDFNPEPVISINPEGRVIHANDPSNALYSSGDLSDVNLTEFINFPFDVKEYIQNDRAVHFSAPINNRHYSIYFQGISGLQTAQVYLHDITDVKNYEERLIESERRQKELAGVLREKFELEKQNLAGQIYDEVNQNLSVVRLKLQNLTALRNNETNSEEYLKTIDLLENTINVLKNISFNLKPKILDEVGLAPAITSLCHEVSRKSGIKGSVNVLQADINMDKKCATYLFRIIEEALSNVVRHSRATEFSVQLIDNEKYTRVFLSDNGIGFEPEKINRGQKQGLGLLNIKERTEALNGKLKIDSFLNKGTVIIVEVPKQAGFVHA
ncbi:MAG: sensor histidine kinase [Syntrophomonadaceae bacterium]